MRRTLKVLECVRDDRGRLGRLLLVGGSELLVFFFVSRMLSVVAGHSRLEQWWWNGELSQALATRSPALILPVQVLVMSLPFVELSNIYIAGFQ